MSQNIVVEDAQDVGEWSGTCSCPDGNRYKVGDNNDGCQSIACIGGIPSGCNSR